MAKYQINTPSGEVEVTAESEAAALQIAKKEHASMPKIIFKGAGNVRVFERKNGYRYAVTPVKSITDPKKIQEIMDGTPAGEQSKQGIREDIIKQYPFASRLNQFVRGVPFIGSYADDVVGAIAGDDAQAGMNALSDAMENNRPGQSTALNVGGAIASTPAMLAAAPQALTNMVVGNSGRMLPAMLRGSASGATVGSIEGGIYGAGDGDAVGGMQTGAIAGALPGAGMPVVQKTANAFIERIKRSDLSMISKGLQISRDAAKVIKNVFEQGGDMMAARLAISRAGKEGMLADAGPAAQALLDASAASGGEASATAQSAINQRMVRANQALDSTMDSTLGPAPLGPKTAVDNIAEKTRPQRSEAYGEAYKQSIDYGSPAGLQLTELLDRAPAALMRQAIDEANEAIQMDGLIENTPIIARISDGGKVVFDELMSVRQIDELKRAIQNVAYGNTDDFGRLNAKGNRYEKFALELRNALTDAVPAYGRAIKIGGDKISEERAFALGADLLKTQTPVETVFRELGSDASQAQLSAAKSGMRSYIDKAVGNVRAIASSPSADELDARQVVKVVLDLSSDNARKKIRGLLGDEADAFLAKIDQAGQSSVVKAAMAVNSKTAQRQAIQGTVDDITQPGIVGSAMQGEPVNTSKALIQAITGQTAEYTTGRKQQIFNDIARALTEKGDKSAQAALTMIERAIQGQPLRAAENEFLAKQIALTGYSAGLSGMRLE